MFVCLISCTAKAVVVCLTRTHPNSPAGRAPTPDEADHDVDDVMTPPHSEHAKVAAGTHGEAAAVAVDATG